MNKTGKLLTGVLVVTVIAATSCQDEEALPDTPDDPSCDDWEWEADEGVWECDDYDSSYYGHYYYGGSYYSSKNKLTSSSSYKSYKTSSSFKGGSSGFGSGKSGGFGG
ncbi:hypothetical protein [Metabacillus malikii]|uniref:Aminotransferase yhxA n=1 Tax=Metabacillus malikii TaxID=1504265 RepID=A0ABT9ZEU2_9BACI|nr:hypothetical protein [Metabacillus malikii]MDQ0230776.1 hypothetical protein [Metabacillus malikii]